LNGSEENIARVQRENSNKYVEIYSASVRKSITGAESKEGLRRF
jgi:hypothetical protein